MTNIAHHPAVGALDAESVRREFPLFRAQPELAFLDTAASAQKPDCVIDAEAEFYRTSYANIHRGVYKLSQKATTAYEAARETVRQFINAKSVDEIVFVRGATEAINLVAHSWGRKNLKAGDGVLLSTLEHHANIVPWQLLREELGIELHIADINAQGQLTVEAVQAALKPNTKLVAVTHMSNAIGTVTPIADIIKLAHGKNIPVLVDGCQAAVHQPIDVQALDADFYVFSGHKLYGPSGIGVLYGKYDLLDAMPPYQGGGDMIRRVSFEKTTFAAPPSRFEAGTPNIAGAVGLAEAIRFVTRHGLNRIAAHEQELATFAATELAKIDGLHILGDAPKGAIVSFVVDGIHPHDLATILDECGVCVRAGHHCAQPLMDWFKTPATTRASFAAYNTKRDADQVVAAVKKACDLLR